MKKVKEIPLTGLSTSPSDYEVPDGALSIAKNVLFEDKAICSSSSACPKLLLIGHSEYDEDSYAYAENVLYNHSTNVYKHLIYSYVERKSLKTCYSWIDMPSSTKYFSPSEIDTFDIISGIDINDVISIGNILIFYADTEAYYFLFKSGKYSFLGNKIPEIEISFGLKPHVYNYAFDCNNKIEGSTETSVVVNLSGEETVIIDGHDEDYDLDCRTITSQSDISSLTDASLGIIGQFTKEWCNEKAYFSQPFLIRCAYRLYDGSTIMSTAPVLLRPSTFANPMITIDKMYNLEMHIGCLGIASEIEYSIKNKKEQLESWKDIIKSIDFFVSSPFYTYDQSEKIKSYVTPKRQSGSTSFDKNAPVPKLSSVWEHISINKNKGDKYDSVKTQWDTVSNNWSTDEIGISKGTKVYVDEQYIKDSNGYIVAKRETRAGVHEFIYGLTKYDDTDIFRIERYFPTAFVLIPISSKSKIDKEIKECSLFYHIKTVKIEEIDFDNDSNIVEIDKYCLNELETKERLIDDYRSHDVLIPSSISVYNKRINMTDVKRYYFDGFSPFSLFQHIDGDEDYRHYRITSLVYIKTQNGNIAVKRDDIDGSTFNGFINENNEGILNYAYYPDTSAFRMEIIAQPTFTANILVASVELDAHAGLNGSLYFDGLERRIRFEEKPYMLAEQYINSIEEYYEEKFITDFGTIYTSDTNNPFIFKAENVEELSSGDIKALVPIAMPLTQDATGGADMIAFTSEGTWTLTPSSTGGWSSKHCISRDIIIDRFSYLQLDMSIIFATERGLMHISGTSYNNIQIQCITDIFNGGKDFFCTKYQEQLKKLISKFSYEIQNTEYSDTVNYLKEYINGSNMHYDYANQRIIIGHEDKDESFVFNIKDSCWTTLPLHITSAVNSFPNSLAMAIDIDEHDREIPILIDLYSKESDISYFDHNIPSNGFILTRPIKLDEPDALKTIHTVIARGNFNSNQYINGKGAESSPVSLILYGSRDLNTWFVISSSEGHRLVSRHGTPYRYFRVALITRLKDGESLSRLTIEYDLKLDNKLR